MKGIYTVLIICLAISGLGYLAKELIAKHIDQEAGEIVEQTLSDNTIQQFKTLIEIQAFLKSGNIEAADEKISESIGTLEFIIKNNCTFPKCKKALSNYEPQ